jgi:2-keto-4-pentenoate hydratase/2-oxohepta-3-ene-1,7-dioic acid hydratase in catechol pathway
MIVESLASGADVPAYNTPAYNFANRFAKFLCDLVRQSKVKAETAGYTPTAEQFCRDWSIENTINQIVVEDGTVCSVYRGLPIFSELIHWLSRDVELKPDDLDYTGKAEGFGAVVADDLLHARIDGLPPLRDSIS